MTLPPTNDTNDLTEGLPELAPIIDMMQVVEARLEKGRPLDLETLPNLIQALCEAIETLPESETEAASSLLDQVYAWLETLETALHDAADQTLEPGGT